WDALGGLSRTGTVTGKVTYDGEIVPVGTITFFPEKGKPVFAEIVHGEYKAEKVPVGPVTVTVSTSPHRSPWRTLKQQKDQHGSGGEMQEAGGIVNGESKVERVPLGQVTFTVSTSEQRKNWRTLKEQKDEQGSGGQMQQAGGQAPKLEKDK